MPGNVGAARRRRDGATEDQRVEQRRQLRRQGVLPEQRRVDFGRRPAVAVLVLEGNQALVEQRIALAPDLDELAQPPGSVAVERIDTCRRLVVA